MRPLFTGSSWAFASVLVAFLFPGVCYCTPQSAPLSPSEDEIKAVVLYHLTQFIQWPDKNDGGLYRICVAGGAGVSSALEHLTQGRLIGSHAIAIENIAGPAAARGCRILFVAACARPRLQQYLTSVRDSGILTIGEQPGFVEIGGMVQLSLDGKHTGMTLNLETIARSHLTVSSKFLRLDRNVRLNTHGDN